MLADIFASADGGDAALGTKGIALPLNAQGREDYVAHVLPLTCGARRRGGTAYHAAAALFVHKAGLDAPSPPEAFAKAYRLTPMELRVLRAVVEMAAFPRSRRRSAWRRPRSRPTSAISMRRPAPVGRPISSSSSPALPIRSSTEQCNFAAVLLRSEEARAPVSCNGHTRSRRPQPGSALRISRTKCGYATMRHPDRLALLLGNERGESKIALIGR
jgi:hypothetical protein